MRKSILAGITAVALVLLLFHVSTLQAAGGIDVMATHNDDYGTILTDAEGYSLYLYTEDTVGSDASASQCQGACVRNWPPLLVEGGPTAGEGANADLLGTIKRSDGSTQVTYNGWPLYRYVRDGTPGNTRGSKLGGVFFLVSPAGERVTQELVREIHVEDDVFAALMSEGEQVFTSNCAVCHGDQGQGRVGPRLAGNSATDRTEFIVGMILDGFPTTACRRGAVGFPIGRSRRSPRLFAIPGRTTLGL